MLTLVNIAGFPSVIDTTNPSRIDIHVSVPGTTDIITFMSRDARAKAQDARHFQQSVINIFR